MVVPVDPEVLTNLQKECTKSNKEICGIVSTNQEVFFIPNISKTPSNSFLMDQAQYFRALNSLSRSGLGVLCLFHTHPGASPEPSEKDLEFMKKSAYAMLIVSSTSWRYLDGPD